MSGFIVRLLKQLVCKHEYVFERNIYGDEINHVGGHRSWWRCEKCGKRALGEYLYPEDEGEVKPWMSTAGPRR